MSGWSGETARALRSVAVVGVVAARGGAGATTVAALLATALARRTATVLVDLVGGAGLDVTVGAESVPGPRWPDLVAAGDVPGDQLLAALPRWGRVALVSADRARPCLPPPHEVLDRLGEAAGAVVLDLPACDVLAHRAPVAHADIVVVVAGRDATSVAGAVALRAALGPAAARTGLMACDARRGRLGLAELEQSTNLPLLGRVRHDRTLLTSTERGLLRPRRSTTRAPDTLATTVLGARDTRAGAPGHRQGRVVSARRRPEGRSGA
ncbi:MAG: pilus assembly protein FlpE [Micrococcales bacterium]|nr:pilus assembly protein FlpE [Micrococcales bacterium]